MSQMNQRLVVNESIKMLKVCDRAVIVQYNKLFSDKYIICLCLVY